MFLLKTKHSNKNYIIKGFITALFLSSFIYLSYFGIEIKIINTVLALLGLYFLVTIDKKSLISAGFFIGIFWCYWMAVSLQYYELTYLFPIVVFGIAIVYALIFYLFGLINNNIYRITAIFLFTFLVPFGFNWLKLELIFIDSYIDISKIAFALVLVSIFLLVSLKKLKFLAVFPLLFAFDYSEKVNLPEPSIDIFMPQLEVKQGLKWEKEYRKVLHENNFDLIVKAIEEKKELIVLPETSFTAVLNKNAELRERLSYLSNDIEIVTGALYVEDNQIYNATYHFSNEKMQIAKKVVLVPFGEEIPLPQFFVDLINEIFYDGAQDYSKASKATDFLIKGEKFRNAICYEGTTDKIFEDLNDTKYMIMISNNAWFTPSIEPTLQHLLLKYYSKKYQIMIFHTANGSPNRIYRP